MASTATESLSKLDLNADFASSAPNLQHNLHLFSPQQVPFSLLSLSLSLSLSVYIFVCVFV